MPLTFGLTGMDPATETSLKAAFAEANERIGGLWQLQPETSAQYVVVDMDSLYGPMSWLRLHAAGKIVIGLTSAPRTQTDHHLNHPFDANSVARLLQEVATKAGHGPGVIDAEAPSPAGLTPAPQPQDLLPEEQPLPADEEMAPPPEPSAAIRNSDVPLATGRREPPSAAVGQVIPPAPTIQPRAPSAPSAQAQQTLVEWLASGKLAERIRLERDGVALLIDTRQREYFGPTALKPLAAHLQAHLSAKDLEPVAASDWNTQTAALGSAQPLLRLVWFGNLLAGAGQLVPGFDLAGRFQLVKWPQTEREFPKHFRIATMMMKGPATLAEIASGSGVPLPEVIDFVNANLATGFADVEHVPEPEPESSRSTGLFGRLRGR